MSNPHTIPSQSVLASLRRLVPFRRVSPGDALALAEQQAAMFRQLVGCAGDALDERTVAGLPRISIQRRTLPTSGLSYWDGDNWIIALNRNEPAARQRFTLMHEYKHIVDHGATDRLYVGTQVRTPNEQAEQAADYFAGCVLMPTTLVRKAWAGGTQSLSALAEQFQVSVRAVEVRLAQVGLTDQTRRCEPPRVVQRPGRGSWYRAAQQIRTEGTAA